MVAYDDICGQEQLVHLLNIGQETRLLMET
jgi:hypothetical protein